MLVSLLRKVDKLFFNGGAERAVAVRRSLRHVTSLEKTRPYNFCTSYKKGRGDVFSRLCEKYGSDKGDAGGAGRPYWWPSHTYSDFYWRLYSHCRSHVRLVFECGIGSNNSEVTSNMGPNGRPGASLRVWRDFFPNAMVVGADIDRGALFEEERIKTYFVDQCDAGTVRNLWNQVGSDSFDLIVDDGLHTFEAGVCLFENSIFKLAEDGIYVIEDVHTRDLLRYEEYFRDAEYVVDFVNLYYPGADVRNNHMVVVRHQD